jgi:hypothetical protein
VLWGGCWTPQGATFEPLISNGCGGPSGLGRLLDLAGRNLRTPDQ